MQVNSVNTVNHTSYTHRNRKGAAGRNKSIIYFSAPAGETVAEQLTMRRLRPYNEYRKLLPAVLEAAGVTAPSTSYTVKWSQRAGCSCPCSPGFVFDGYDGSISGKDIHVAVKY
jgi:hypothetical protein